MLKHQLKPSFRSEAMQLRRSTRSRRVIQDEDESQSQSLSPIRRSSRLQSQRAQAHQSDDESDEDSDVPQMSNNNNHNHNNNNSQQQQQNSDEEDDSNESDIIFNEEKKDQDSGSSSSDSDTKEEIENEQNKHPDYSYIFPRFINKLADRYKKIDEDIQDLGLPRLIDTAQCLAEYNSKQNNYNQYTKRLENTMNKLLNLSKSIKIEQVKYY